ncbi:MAG: EAL domain-containing protein [Gammaproteobacteria bacterium]|nr:EAL domain-containing protein [Gammaproteobacteria bacterium]
MKRSAVAVFAGCIAGLVLSLFFYLWTLNNFILNAHLILTIVILLAGSFAIVTLYLFRKVRIQGYKIHRLTTTKQQAEFQLIDSNNRFETLFEHANVGIALLALDGRLSRVNQPLCELLGYTESDILMMNFYYIIHPNDLGDLQIHIQQLIDKKIKSYQSEQQCFRKNGDTLWIMSTLSLICDYENNPVHFVIQIQNITLQKKAEERLRHMAYHDPVTGLANRNKLEQFINHILASARRHQQGFALLFLDLDRFKNINDTIGHEAGDMLLQVMAERLRSTVRSTDMVARLGGDEFVLLITDVKKEESVAIIAQKILENVMKVVVIKGQEIYITTSVGISLYPLDGQNMQTLMKNADLALYRSKEHGRNNYEFYTVEMTSKAQKKMSVQNALGHALVKNEFNLHYQPMMEIQSRRITGVEALLRWQNKDYGMITPDEIISIAEETGLIIPVSDWVIKTACSQLKIWHDMGIQPLSIAINCSSRQFKQATFIDDVFQTLNKIGLSPHCLEIEVTEAIIMENPENTLRILYALKDLGVQIAIDDFGTGYWSLNNLRRLQVDKIKIDKTFIKQISFDETSDAIISAIIAMSKKLGIRSIAEGVETRAQYEFLAKEGCTEIQGYYLTHPLIDTAMTTFLKHPVPDAENTLMIATTKE